MVPPPDAAETVVVGDATVETSDGVKVVLEIAVDGDGATVSATVWDWETGWTETTEFPWQNDGKANFY